MIEKLSKNFFLHISRNKLLNAAAHKWGYKLGAAQVVAGDSIEGMVTTVKKLNEKGLECTIDHLGEYVLTKTKAIEAAEHNIKTLQAIADNKLNSQLSVKLTQLGLDLDRDLCIENMHSVLKTAKRNNLFVTIDMENYQHYQQTLDILNELRNNYDHVGTVIQAYLYRAEKDIHDLKGVALRIVKGAYKETSKIAFQRRKETDENFNHLIQLHLKSGSFTAIATHDHHIIERVKEFVAKHHIPNNQFEFQMLYGFRTDIQTSLLKEGFSVRIYVPYGKEWFAYYMRRLAERPQNISLALKSFFTK